MDIRMEVGEIGTVLTAVIFLDQVLGNDSISIELNVTDEDISVVRDEIKTIIRNLRNALNEELDREG